MLLLGAMVPGAYAQYAGNAQWKWDTVMMYNALGVPVARYMQECDVSGRITEQLTQEKSGAEWVNDTRILMAYENGRIVASITSLWANNIWNEVMRITPGYDGLGRVISELVEQMKPLGWTNYRMRYYAYGPQNRKEQVLQERWSNGAWLYDTKTDYTYDGSGFLDKVTLSFSETGEEWTDGMRLIYTCDQNGNWLEAVMESGEGGVWTTEAKVFYVNDARGNILSETYALRVGNAWVNEFRRMYTYDAYDNAITGRNEIFSNMAWVPETTSSYIYYKQDFLVMLEPEHYRFTASYKHFPLGLEERQRKMLTLFPNPADDSFRLGGLPDNAAVVNTSYSNASDSNASDLEIMLFNEAGALVRTATVLPGGTVNSAGLENGLYIIRVGDMVGKVLIWHR